MNINPSIKILLIACSEEEASDSVIISNKLAGIEYNYFNPFESNLSKLRILEFTWNSMDIELWNYILSDGNMMHDLADETLPAICFMDACGLILISNEPPVNFIQRNNSFFFSMDFPILWIANEKYTRGNPLESSLQSLNLTKILVKSPDDSAITGEFNQLLMRVSSYLSGGRM